MKVLSKLILVFVCGNFSVYAQLLVEDYFPLAIGNKWSYQSTANRPWNEEIISDTIWDGKEMYKTLRDSVGPHEEWRCIINGEARIYFDSSNYCVYLKEPLEVGNEWEFSPGDTAVIRKIDAVITVPAGTFYNCVEMDASNFSSDSIAYFAPGIGLAKGVGFRIVELTDYIIKGSSVEFEDGFDKGEKISLRCTPSVFTERTKITYELSEKNKVSVKIYNIFGESVKEIKSGIQRKGKHSVIWDGRDDNSEKISSGIYFLKIEAGEKEASTKVMFVR